MAVKPKEVFKQKCFTFVLINRFIEWQTEAIFKTIYDSNLKNRKPKTFFTFFTASSSAVLFEIVRPRMQL